MRLSAVVVLVFASLSGSLCFAKVDPKLKGDDLKRAVSLAASQNHHSVGYNTARKDVLGSLSFEEKNNQYIITEVYCEEEIATKGPGHLPDNSVLNVEHTWPQSKFGGSEKGNQKSDMHHLFPSDAKMNGIRGNHPFGEVVYPTSELKCDISKIGQNETGTLVFEPPVGHRGNVARALFYFSVRYKLQIDKDQEQALRRWNETDPVDEVELSRNNAIQEIQGNRNPFIDQPELVDSIDDF